MRGGTGAGTRLRVCACYRSLAGLPAFCSQSVHGLSGCPTPEGGGGGGAFRCACSTAPAFVPRKTAANSGSHISHDGSWHSCGGLVIVMCGGCRRYACQSDCQQPGSHRSDQRAGQSSPMGTQWCVRYAQLSRQGLSLAARNGSNCRASYTVKTAISLIAAAVVTKAVDTAAAAIRAAGATPRQRPSSSR
jgi:hypothetical protein